MADSLDSPFAAIPRVIEHKAGEPVRIERNPVNLPRGREAVTVNTG